MDIINSDKNLNNRKPEGNYQKVFQTREKLEKEGFSWAAKSSVT